MATDDLAHRYRIIGLSDSCVDKYKYLCIGVMLIRRIGYFGASYIYNRFAVMERTKFWEELNRRITIWGYKL